MRYENRLVLRCDHCHKESVVELPEGQYVCEIETIKDSYFALGNDKTYPCGREQVIDHIKGIGQKLIDNAEKIVDNEIIGEKVVAIEFSGRIAVNEITRVEMRKVMNII